MHFLFLHILSVTQLTEGRVEQREEEPALNSPSNQINQNGKKFFRLSCEGNTKMRKCTATKRQDMLFCMNVYRLVCYTSSHIELHRTDKKKNQVINWQESHSFTAQILCSLHPHAELFTATYWRSQNTKQLRQ